MISSISSVPIESRTKSGVTPVSGLLLYGKLLVGRACRVDYKAL